MAADEHQPTTEDYDWAHADDTAQDPDIVNLHRTTSADYIAAYTDAWRRLLPARDTLAIPILYLQRHTLELVVKEILSFLLRALEEVLLTRAVFESSNADHEAAFSALEKDWATLHGCHRFDVLFECLTKNLVALRLPPELPEDFLAAKDMLKELEGGDETRLRYDTVPDPIPGEGQRKKRHLRRVLRRPSFGVDLDGVGKDAPVGKLATVLGRIVDSHKREESEPPSLGAVAGASMMSAYGDLCSKLQEVENLTRSGALKWSVRRDPPIDITNHMDFMWRHGGIPRVSSVYLAAEYGGRPLVVFALLDAVEVTSGGTTRRENELVLAAQLSDGTLTRRISPIWHQSNVIHAVLESLRASGDLPAKS